MKLNVLLIVMFCMSILSCRNTSEDNEKYVDPAEARENLIKANRVLIKKDRQRIIGVVDRKGWNMTETQTGLWYEILEDGVGKNASQGMNATINYTLSLLDGQECYSSDESGPKSFTIGRGGVESGLEQGILLCKNGSKMRLILPPHLAHGLPGDGERIPARAIVVYEIEVVDLSK